MRDFFEPRLQTNLENVRLHADEDAAQQAEGLGAAAFTRGSDIYFACGQFHPETAKGQRLLAHELTHVLQQSDGHAGPPHPKAGPNGTRLRTRHVALGQTPIQRAVEPMPAAPQGSTPAQDSGFPGCAEVAPTNSARPDFTEVLTNAKLIRIRLERPGRNENLLGRTATRGAGAAAPATRLVQQALVAWGCEQLEKNVLPTFGVDGDFGAETERAVRAFQSSEGIADDGIVGPITLKRLDQFVGAAEESAPDEPALGEVPLPPIQSPEAFDDVALPLLEKTIEPTKGSEPASPGAALAKTAAQQQGKTKQPELAPIFGDFCDPYNLLVGHAVHAQMVLNFLPAISATFGTEVGGLWAQYLFRVKGASLAPKVFNSPSSSIVKGFAKADTTSAETTTLLEKLEGKLLADPARCPKFGAGPIPFNTMVAFPLEDFFSKSELGNRDMNFGDPFSIPGNIAGNVGDSDAGPDTRSVSGRVRFQRIPAVNGPGTGSLRMTTDFRYSVKDAVDFCPLGSGDPGAGFEQPLTIPLSRLEATNLAYDNPFRVDYNAPEKGKTIVNPKILKSCFPEGA